MNGHVKRMSFQQYMELTTTLLSLLLVMAVDSTRTVAASRSQQCGNSLQQTLKLARLAQKESVDLIKTYKAAQGEMSELFCKVSVNNVPDPNISGLEPSERIASIYTHLQTFMAHFKRVYEQQTDLQLPSSPLLAELTGVSGRSRGLAALINGFYQSLFPNLPMPEPAGGPTTLPPPQNVFQQKVYGCVVLKTYKEFLSNVSRELRTLKGKVCRRRIEMNTFY
ncbi:IL-6 subfamily cytokine M17 isoform X2 [Hippoglossus hippoglossus]|uniref:IL-6 subfamily cytokine M17 isoform X2 n=1 Tax=Hippoglossus hippoglossus TaxID=8267 RepID=UPI00148BF452|nr:IL-6 subfamily cytokine M17 isoform X2 [Hippoglossus hippoglossus]XP_035040803.1 IL-6 subfamily cytokine M17 isoform X1 [Hippoglossus stenolepis]